MEIKRKFEILVATNRRYVIRQSAAADRQTACAECGAPVVTVEQAAKILGITQRRIFQIVETGAAHYAESESGRAAICLTSLTTNINNKTTI